MKVYILTYRNRYDECEEIMGVFSSLEKVEELKKETIKNFPHAYTWNALWLIKEYLTDEGV